MLQCQRRVSTPAVTLAVHSLLMQDKDIARNTNSLTDRQLQSVVTTASGRGLAKRISASIQCVYVACNKDDMFLQQWSTISFRTVATRFWCGTNPTGKPYANPVTIKKRGRKIRILFIHTENPLGGIKIPKKDKTLTGGPSHAQKWVFKHPIDPSEI